MFTHITMVTFIYERMYFIFKQMYNFQHKLINHILNHKGNSHTFQVCII